MELASLFFLKGDDLQEEKGLISLIRSAAPKVTHFLDQSNTEKKRSEQRSEQKSEQRSEQGSEERYKQRRQRIYFPSICTKSNIQR